MRTILIIVYMLFRHPLLFFKYTIKTQSRGFLVNGSAKDLKINRLTIGKNVRFGHDTRIGFYGTQNEWLTIGDNCYFVNGNSFLVGGAISIGSNCLFASNILVTSENYEIEIEKDRPYQNIICESVTIGSGCWIGEKAIIMPGVTIGQKCVIGAGSVVTKSIPDYSIAVGNPAHVIKQYDSATRSWKDSKT